MEPNITKKEINDFQKKLDEANSINISFRFFIWAILFGILSGLVANIIHDSLKSYKLVYIYIVLILFFLTAIKMTSFVINQMESKYKKDKLYKYFLKNK